MHSDEMEHENTATIRLIKAFISLTIKSVPHHKSADMPQIFTWWSLYL